MWTWSSADEKVPYCVAEFVTLRQRQINSGCTDGNHIPFFGYRHLETVILDKDNILQ